MEKKELYPRPDNCLLKLYKFLRKYNYYIYNLDDKDYYKLKYSASTKSFYLKSIFDTQFNKNRYRISKIELLVGENTKEASFRLVLTDNVTTIKSSVNPGYAHYTYIEIVSMKNVCDLFNDNMSHYEVCEKIHKLKLRIVSSTNKYRHIVMKYKDTGFPQKLNNCDLIYTDPYSRKRDEIKNIKFAFMTAIFRTGFNEIDTYIYQVDNMESKFLDDYCGHLPSPDLVDLNNESFETKFNVLQKLIGIPDKKYIELYGRYMDKHPSLEFNYKLYKPKDGLMQLSNDEETVSIDHLTFFRNFIRCYSKKAKMCYNFKLTVLNR